MIGKDHKNTQITKRTDNTKKHKQKESKTISKSNKKERVCLMSMICEADKNTYIEPDYISTNNHPCEDTEMITVQMTPEVYKEFVRMRLLEETGT